MSSAAKAKGSRWELALRRGLAAFFEGEFGLAPVKPYAEGRDDVGDIHGLGPFVGQAKDWRSWEDAIREGLDGAEKQSRASGLPYAVAFVKRARRPVGEGYAVMRVETFARVLRRLQRAEHILAHYGPDDLDDEHARRTADDLDRPFPRT